MTASLPVPNDVDPEEPDRHSDAEVVPLAGGTPAPGSKRTPPRKPKAKKKPAARSSGAAGRAKSTPKADPGPPPPLPSDLDITASAAADIIVPPKPPLPAGAREEAGSTGVEAEGATLVDAEVEPAETDAASPAVAEPAEVARPDAVASEESEAADVDVASDVTPEDVVAEPIEAEEVPSEDVAAEEILAEEIPAEDVAAEELPAEEVVPAPVEAEETAAPEVVAGSTEAEEIPAEEIPAEDVVSEEISAAEVPAQEVAPEDVFAEPIPSEDVATDDVELEASTVAPAVDAEDGVIAEPSVDAAPIAPAAVEGDVLVMRGVSKRFGSTDAIDAIDLTVPSGTFYGLVGPNGAGKTTTLSIIAGLLVPDRGTIQVGGVDARARPLAAKKLMGVLPDRLRTFDRLTGRQLLYYYGVLRGLSPAVVESRTADLARAFDLGDALGRRVSDYSAGMLKKVMLAGAMIHSPRLLVLDEPFEAVDPVSSAIILDILSAYVAHGGTVILSSHGMELVERVCTRVAVIVAGQVLAEGTVDEVRGELTLEQRFVELAGGLSDVEGLEWLHTFSG